MKSRRSQRRRPGRRRDVVPTPDRIRRHHLALTVLGGALVYSLMFSLFAGTLYKHQAGDESFQTEQYFGEPSTQGQGIASMHNDSDTTLSSNLNSASGDAGTIEGIVRSSQTAHEATRQKSQKSHQLSPDKSRAASPLAIFYNIFIPDQPQSYKENALNIVKEQIGQVGDSYAASLGNTTIHYNTIGSSSALTVDIMSSLCLNHSLNCNHMRHYEQAYEEVTLQRLYDYCQDHQDHNVVYMHSKGSFHTDNGKNDRLRRHLTRAVTDEKCMNPPNGTCNLCGLAFGAFPIHFPGNFFVAQCSYVQKLVPPTVFGAAMEVVTAKAKQGLKHKEFVRTMFPDEAWFYGTERYSAEHWVGSHPDVRPCDLTARHLSFWQRKDRSSTAMDFAMAPRKEIDTYVRDLPVPLDESLRLRDYALLPGLLFKWYALYDRPPASDSWIWTFFPDGSLWKEAVETHGQKAIESLTQKYRPARAKTSDLSVDDSSSPDYVIFFNIYTANFRGVKAQLDQLGKSYAAAAARRESKTLNVFYATVGASEAFNATEMDTLCAVNKLACRHLNHFDSGREEAALQPMQQFCQSHPSHKVVYIHNDDTLFDNPGQNTKYRWHSEAAVTSEGCIRPVNGTCNVCGLIFTPLPRLSFSGNMFTSQCSYINRLMEPDSFEIAQPELGALVKQLVKEDRMVARDGEPTSETLGFAESTMSHWIGSHPSLVPCDMVSTARKFYWANKKRNLTAEFDWSMAPRSSEAYQDIFTQKDSLRMREYSILPGLIFKWFALYNAVAPSSSWVWSFFPDGNQWRESVEAHGNRSFDEMTKPYRSMDF